MWGDKAQADGTGRLSCLALVLVLVLILGWRLPRGHGEGTWACRKARL